MGVSDHDVLYGSVARLVPQKALHILLEGYAQFLINSKTSSKLFAVMVSSSRT